MAKKKVMILTDYIASPTGFGRHGKELLTYLYNNYQDKIEIIHIAGGVPIQIPDFQRFPWEIYGVLPNDQPSLERLQKDQGAFRMAAYGEAAIEDLVFKTKPDVILGIQDTWALGFLRKKAFFGKVPIIFHETVDSLPLLKEAIENAKGATEYWTWSSFPIESFKKNGVDNVKCQYPLVNTKIFKRLSDSERLEIRKKHGLDPNMFVTGFVFRSQPRKLVDKLIQGFSIFQRDNPEVKNAYLYCQCNWSEGWKIPDLCKQYNVDIKKVLCSYICKHTKQLFVSHFQGEELKNPITGIPKSLITANLQHSLSVEQLNEVYNIFDSYQQPCSSGAAEIPLVEASLTEIPVATCPYSFGEDVCKLNKGCLPIDYVFYTECGTNFLKSNPNPNTIAKIIKKLYYMSPDKRRELGKLARQWALDNYDSEVNGEKIAQALLAIPPHSWNFNREESVKKNPNYPCPNIENETLWLQDLYKNILLLELPSDDGGLNGWKQQMSNGMKREDIYKFFVQTAQQDNSKSQKISFESFLDKDDEGRRILFSLKESAGDILLCLSLFKDCKKLYPDWNIYFACDPQYFDIVNGNEYIHKVIPWAEMCDSELHMSGAANHRGYFNIAFCPGVLNQKFLNYLRNGVDRTNIEYKNDDKVFFDEFTVLEN